jgi:hypothetical protein
VGGAVLAALAVVWARLSEPPTPDVAWLLYAANVLRGGGTLGTDVVENSPPIIFWLKVPVLAIGDTLGLAAWPSWVAALVVASLLSALLIHRLSKGLVRGVYLGPLAAAVFLLLPGRDFGQREHVALILTVPWLIAIARRLEGRPAPAPECWIAIVLAAVGLGIKPHFGLVWLAVAWLAAFRARSWRALLRPEVTGVAVLGVVQIVAVAVFHPSYFDHLRLYGRAYIGFLAIPIWQALLIGAGPAAVLFAILARIALRAARERTAEGSTVLLAGAIGFWLAAGLQQKGWSYHYLPAQGIALLAVGALLVETPPTVTGLSSRIYRAAGVGALAMALIGPALHSVLDAARFESPDRSGLDRNLGVLLPIVRAAGQVGPVFVFSTNLASSFPLVSEAGARWAFRHPSLLMLGAAYAKQLDGAGMVRPRPLAGRTAAERRVADELAEDLRHYRPAAMLVVRPDPGNPGWGGAKRFDYLGYFLADPQFTRILADYKDAGVFGDYSLLLREGVSIPVEPGHPAPSSGNRGALGFGSGRVRWMINPLGLVVFGLAFGVAYGRGGRRRRAG